LFVSDSINPAIKWGFGTTDLFHIVRHPKCARATAKMIYWRGSPVETLAKGAKLSAWGRETRSLLKEIERGMRSGKFQNVKIAYNPQKDLGLGKAAWERARKTVPDYMLAP